MTAEIAILNKSAVALATDSMITIATGSGSAKVYDSADKLFELSYSQPIGIMIYNATSFAGIPLAELIKQFRSRDGKFNTIRDAADAFLSFLNEVGIDAPRSVQLTSIDYIVDPILDFIKEEVTSRIQEEVTRNGPPEDFLEYVNKETSSIIAAVSRRLERQEPPVFFGTDKAPDIGQEITDHIQAKVDQDFRIYSDDVRRNLTSLLLDIVIKGPLSPSLGGMVISGYGEKEIFPTLISFEVEGVVASHLKYRETAFCDIDREGVQAFVKPFAQKEMVERFLYGLDNDIQRRLTSFVRRLLPSIAESILERIGADDSGLLDDLKSRFNQAERAFVEALRDNGFTVIEEEARQEIEDMVRFMPKPELARMAEALVNLTSLKRKVTMGPETVGGPVDVAIISKYDGFVWIKRKHYFPPELNGRYLARLKS